MNLGEQLRTKQFADNPIVEEGLTRAQDFITNRFLLFKSLDDDATWTVEDHVAGKNMPPVVFLDQPSSPDEPYASFVREPFFSERHGVETTSEGGVVFHNEFGTAVRSACAYPHDDLRRRVYTCMISCSYVHEMGLSNVHRFYDVKDASKEFDDTPDKFRCTFTDLPESGYFAEEKLFGGCMYIRPVTGRFNILLMGSDRTPVNVLIRLKNGLDCFVTEKYITLLESILSCQVLYDDEDSLLLTAMKALAVSDVNQKESEEKEHSREALMQEMWAVGSMRNCWWNRKPECVEIRCEKNQITIEIEDSSKKSFSIRFRGRYKGRSVSKNGSDAYTRCSMFPKNYIYPGETTYSLDDLFDFDGDVTEIDVIIWIGFSFETSITVSV